LIDGYQKYIDLNPNDVEAHYFMGHAYAKLREPAASITCYRRAALLGHAASQSALRSLGLLC
jgi:cytochrome c-type biogenesis protein CcmH/NrfG